MEHKSNKIIALEFYKKVIGERDDSLIDLYVSDEYIQHSPMLKQSKAALKEAIEFLKQIPKKVDQKSPVVFALEDNDYVALGLSFEFMGKHKFVIDLFRLEHGKLVEHWDAIQDVSDPAGTMAFSTLSAQSGDAVDTLANKSFIRKVFSEPRENKSDAPSTKDFRSHLSDRQKVKVHRVLGEGNLVVVQSEGIRHGKPFVFYDAIRVDDCAVVAHWTVEQQIPDTMPHENGMI